jgi:hypothetical protein
MAKRNRGSIRPGQRHTATRGNARPQQASTRPAGALSDAEEARAAELESQIVAQDRAAADSQARARDRAQTAGARSTRSGGQSLLAARASEEYAYVVRDVRRIIVVGGAMVLLLAAAFVAVDLLHVITIS